MNFSEAESQFFSEQLASELAQRGLRITTAQELGAALGLERQKQLLGCAEDSKSCVTELSGALGVDGIVTGNIGRFGSVVQLNLKVVSSNDGAVLARHTAKVGSPEAVLEELARGARSLAEQLDAVRPAADGTLAAAPARSRSPLPWIVGGAGLLAAGAGAWSLSVAAEDAAKLRASTPPAYETALGLRSHGQTFETGGWIGVGVGAAALATGAVLFVLGDRGAAAPPPTPARVTWHLVPAPGGAVVAGSFP